jgi:hypothetical protein
VSESALHVMSDVVPALDEKTVWERVFEVWAWESNRNANRTQKILSEEWEDTGTPVPNANTIRQRVYREDWHGRRRQLAAINRQNRIERLTESQLDLAELAVDRMFEIFTQGEKISPALRRDWTVQAQLILRGIGIGTWGANQGGLMEFGNDLVLEAEDGAPKSIGERSREQRQRIVAQNKGE